MMQFAAIILIFSGEFFAIIAELYASRELGTGRGFLEVFSIAIFLMLVGGSLLIGGYMVGYAHLKNIWIVMAVSVGSIVVVEPLLAYMMFEHLPTTGAVIGLVLGVVGILAALFLP